MIDDLMDRFAELAATWVWLVLLAAWRAFPILLIVVASGLTLRRRISPALHALLLTLILARLLLPISMGSAISLHKPIDDWFSPEVAGSSMQGSLSYDHARNLLPNVERINEQADPVDATALTIESSFTWEETLWIVMLFVIVTVTMGLILRGVVSHIRFAIRLRSQRLLDDRSLIDLLLRECDQLSVGRRPALREVSSLVAPAVFGLFRKTICLPPRLTETLSEQELRWVIRHELAHIRRQDIPVMILASMATAYHWFNPVVWVIVSRLRAAMELAADRLALQNASQTEISAYGDLLLRFAEGIHETKKSPTLGLISFASGKHLRRRVEFLIRDHAPSRWTTKCLSTVLVFALALAGLTDARELADYPMPELYLVSSESAGSNAQSLSFDPLGDQESEVDEETYVKRYDVADIYMKMPKSLKGKERTPLEQLTAWVCAPPWMRDKLQLNGESLSAELTANQHQLLKNILDAWKDGEPAQISVETRVIQTHIKTANSIDWTGRKIEGLTVRGLGPAIAARIDESELSQLVRDVSADEKSHILFAPKVTLFDGQKASIADQVKRPFVTGVEPKADGSVQPVVTIVDEGLSFVLDPKAGTNGSVTLAFDVRASSIGKVSYANLPIKAPANERSQITVQVPATERYAVSSSVKLSAGESVVVAIPRVFDNKPGADAETTVIVVLTPRVIARQE